MGQYTRSKILGKERVIKKKANHVVRSGNLLIALEFYKKLIEINPEMSTTSHLYDKHIRKLSSEGLFDLFGNP